jgi:hypothetical protein
VKPYDGHDNGEPPSDAAEGMRYCANDHKEYWRDGIYVRARGEKELKAMDGQTVYVCDACYLKHLDRIGRSVWAQLLRDPESIPAQQAEKIRRASEEW